MRLLLPAFSKLARYLSACIGAGTPPPPLSAPPPLSFLAADDFILTCLTRYCSLLLSRNSKTCLCPDEVSVLDVEDERRGALDTIGDNENLTQDSITISNYDNSISVSNHVHKQEQKSVLCTVIIFFSANKKIIVIVHPMAMCGTQWLPFDFLSSVIVSV